MLLAHTFPLVLFFYDKAKGELDAETAAKIQANYPTLDIHYRAKLTDERVNHDLNEKFDGLLGEPPSKYILRATADGKQYVSATIAQASGSSAPPFDIGDDGLLTTTAGTQQAQGFSAGTTETTSSVNTEIAPPA